MLPPLLSLANDDLRCRYWEWSGIHPCGWVRTVERLDPEVECRVTRHVSGLERGDVSTDRAGDQSGRKGTIGGALDPEATLVVGVGRPPQRRLVALHRGYQVGRCCRRNGNRHCVHHVHLFVGQQMAVVDVLPAEVDEVVDDVDRFPVRLPALSERRWPPSSTSTTTAATTKRWGT